MYKDVHLWRGGSAITSAPLVLRSSNFCSAAEKRYADITEKAHFYDAQGETSPSKSPPQKSSTSSVSFSNLLCYTPQSYEYGKFKSWAGEGGQHD